jgi:E1A/CREB-binding protein
MSSIYPSTSNRTFIPPTPGSVNSEMDASIIPSIQPNDPRRNVIQQLALLLHAHKCLQRERQTQVCNGDNHGIIPTTMALNPCTLPHCATMRTVLQHMTKCTDLKTCSCKLFSMSLKIEHFLLI